ncbi:FliM/FliN family flagellar motor switch protein [uncultured Shimia sp.]|uniref:FliM/FliN family flagellar motor switch protein n=1 Tax=uncultured Shimia sp. TaxID=573152 RepID=UPI002609B8EF|nr:FliM/FliN family flagellar motor switch protein [uncultured Shimia sp.]
MASDIESSVLRRMTTEARAPNRVPSVAATLQLACAQAADKALSLPMEVTGAECSYLPHDEVKEVLPERALFAVLEGPAPGFLAVTLPIVGGIVENQTIGRIFSTQSTDREATRVDAALIAPFVDVALARFGASLCDAGMTSWGQGVGFGAMVPDRRSLMLTLPVSGYHVFVQELDIGTGQRAGQLIFGFGDVPQECLADQVTDKSDVSGATVRAGVLASPAQLEAVIARLALPLSQLQSLNPGDTLPIPPDSLRNAGLEAVGGDSAILVALGQLNGFRAVRIKGNSPPPIDTTESHLIETTPSSDIAEAVTLGPPDDSEPPGSPTPPEGLDELLAEVEMGDVLKPV